MEHPALQPFILTLALDGRLFETLNALRVQHFPPMRNVVPAHVTLFHALPSEHEAVIVDDLGALCASITAFGLELPRVRSLGRGVAVEVRSPELLEVRGQLAARWNGWLGAQDRQGYRPHVTIQNKVTKEDARALFEALAPDWRCLEGRALGLELWRYAGGPWLPAGSFRFTAGCTPTKP